MDRLITIPAGYLTYYWMMPLALLQGGCALAVAGGVIGKAIKIGLRWRFLIYLYEIPVAVFLIHFAKRGPIAPSANTASVVYWASVVSLAPLVVVPSILELRTLERLPKGSSTKWPIAKAYFWAGVLTALGLALNSYHVYLVGATL